MFTQSESRGHLALRGLLAAALGATLVVWPGITIGTVAVLFALYALVDAATVTARAFRHGVSGGDRTLLLIRAVIEVIAAGVAIGYPGVTASIMTVILGLYAIAIGGLELAAVGRLSQLSGKRMGWEITQGVLGVLTGVALVVWPSIGAVTLAIVFGLYLAIHGVVLLVSAAVGPRAVTAEVRA
jgi:uncharacterized membrane protein HdeD (DUF308 family)